MKAILDANVLYPAPLRDFWMHLAVVEAFSPRWTDQIHDEWIRNVRLNRPDIPLEQLERTRRLMNQHALDALVSGYEELMQGLVLPDPDDRHVVAAALHTKARVIVTFNLKDFPLSTLEPLGLLAQHPDLFTLELLTSSRDKVLEALSNQRRLMVCFPMTARELLETLKSQGLERTVQALTSDTDRI